MPDAKDRKHLLTIIQLDGTKDEIIFSRPGSAMWAASRIGRGEIGAHLALAPLGGNVAFLGELVEKQMSRALLHQGNLEIWDIEKKVKQEVSTKAINQPMSWFPDGKRLAYVKLVPRDELPKDAPGLEHFGLYFGEVWDEVPAVYLLDVASGKSEFLHVGWTPVVAHDGKSILIGGWDRHPKFSWNSFDLESRRSMPVHWQGNGTDAFAMPAKGIVLFRGLPTADASADNAKTTPAEERDRPVMALKAAVLNSTKFQTIVPVVDPHIPTSFGSVSRRY